MSTLAAARADNFYYPPGWDPSKGSLNKVLYWELEREVIVCMTKLQSWGGKGISYLCSCNPLLCLPTS